MKRVDASKCVAQVYRYLDGIYMSVKCLYRNDEDLSSVYMDNLNCVTAILRYCEDLKSGLVWIWNGQKEVEWQMAWILNRICKPEPNLLKSSQMAAILSKTI